eukprot:TRINITY_DN391_c0_g2_i11.p1 TRINITY_DN391_c0_g2~~TRINITY_DN391_c0_g2_i11.p1  ORF type:complete len:473 (+),score=60.78 TRINITY_DN391_c0_g2_i11:1163-2581(+)
MSYQVDLSLYFGTTDFWCGFTSSVSVNLLSWVVESECPSGYNPSVDMKQCVDINECLSPSTHNYTMQYQYCHNLPGSFECLCSPGSALINGTCQDIDECVDGTNHCSNVCLDGLSPQLDYTCSCPPGYNLSTDNRNCTDYDECNAPTPFFSQICTNTMGGYQCSCETGYSKNGTQCIDKDECSLKESKCEHFCNNTIGSYVCSYRPGYELLKGYICQDIDECLRELNDYDPNFAKCVSGEGYYNCTCPVGYTTYKNLHITSCKPLNCSMEWGPWSGECTVCKGQFINRTKDNGSPLCFFVPFIEISECVFPCESPGTTNGLAALSVLYTEWWIRGSAASSSINSVSWLKNKEYFPHVEVAAVTLDPPALHIEVSRVSSTVACSQDDAQPAIIISYVIPGNPYPTSESKDGKDSLLGSAIQNGYQSHFVIVNKGGNPVQSTNEQFYFIELVIPQEAQVVPAFLSFILIKNLIK